MDDQGTPINHQHTQQEAEPQDGDLVNNILKDLSGDSNEEQQDHLETEPMIMNDNIPVGIREMEHVEEQSIFDMVQIPLIVSILFIIFTLPVVEQNLATYLPFLYKNGVSSVMLILGNTIKSIVLALVLFLIMRLI